MEKKKIFLYTLHLIGLKKGFLSAGFREDQVIVVPHGVDLKPLYLISEEEKKKLEMNIKLSLMILF